MSALSTWWARLSAIVGTAMLAVLVPAAAWASTDVGVLALEAARRRPKGFGGFFGALCCLFVVGIVVVILLLVMRKRRNGQR